MWKKQWNCRDVKLQTYFHIRFQAVILQINLTWLICWVNISRWVQSDQRCPSTALHTNSSLLQLRHLQWAVSVLLMYHKGKQLWIHQCFPQHCSRENLTCLSFSWITYITFLLVPLSPCGPWCILVIWKHPGLSADLEQVPSLPYGTVLPICEMGRVVKYPETRLQLLGNRGMKLHCSTDKNCAFVIYLSLWTLFFFHFTVKANWQEHVTHIWKARTTLSSAVQ